MIHTHLFPRLALVLLMMSGLFSTSDVKATEVFLYGVIKDQDTRTPIDGTKVVVLQEGKDHLSRTTRNDGKYEFSLALGHVYDIYYQGRGLVTKHIVYSTKGIPLTDQKAGFSSNIDMTLFHRLPGMDYSVLDEPLGKASYDMDLGVIEFDLAYAAERQQQFSQLMSAQERAKATLDAGSWPLSPEKEIHLLMEQWHLAAAEADAKTYFDLMADDAFYLGTDKTERWTKSDFMAFATPYFDKGKAWSFTASDRHISFSEDGRIAWLDEQLDTWMGPCRGSAVLRLNAAGWQIVHYDLSYMVANERMDAVIKLTESAEPRQR